MASTRPVMWPPDRGFRREPPSDPAAENISVFEKIIRYAEKDDLLLYVTALFGVFMPAVMYFVYKAVHSRYQAYAKRKRLEKRKEKKSKKAVCIYYAPVSTKFKRLAYDLAEHFEQLDPMVVNLVPDNLPSFRGYKGAALFLIPDCEVDELKDEHGAWFLDWLREMRFEAKQTDLLADLKFATVAINLEKEEAKGELSNLLIKRLYGLDAKQIHPPVFVLKKEGTNVAEQILEIAARFLSVLEEAWSDEDISDDSNMLSSEDEGLSEMDFDEEGLDEVGEEEEPKKDK